jgi:hypothetical protein
MRMRALVRRAVDLEHAARARLLVQPVDVLRHDVRRPAGGLQAREADVRATRLDVRKLLPADEAARPVASLARCARHKLHACARALEWHAAAVGFGWGGKD